jgi:hypothetical protein
MNIYDSVKQAVYTSCNNLLPDNKLIHSHQGGQEPKGSYCALNILKADKIGMECDSTYASADQTIKSTSVYEVTVRFMFVGKDSGNLAYNFETVADNPAARFYFGTESLAIMRKGEVRRVPEKRDTTWVDNFTLDVIFSYAVETTQPIDTIEVVTWQHYIN